MRFKINKILWKIDHRDKKQEQQNHTHTRKHIHKENKENKTKKIQQQQIKSKFDNLRDFFIIFFCLQKFT